MELLACTKCPGKLLISGEHSAVYGKNAVAVTIDLHTTTRIFTNPESAITLKLKNFNFESTWSISSLHGVSSLLTKSKNEYNSEESKVFVYNENALQIVTEILSFASKNDDNQNLTCDNSCLAFLLLYLSISERSFYYEKKTMIVEVESSMPNGAGLGSSSSYIVCLAQALFTAYNCPIDKESFNQWCFEVDKLFHGKPSGVDNTICTYGGAILFRQGKIVEHISHDALENLASMNILLVDTGVSRNTKAMVERCRKKLDQFPDNGSALIDQIGDISQQIWDSMKNNAFTEMSKLFDKNQQLLNELDVGHEKIDEIVYIAKSFGYSAKLSGAGGGGIVFIYISTGADSSDLKAELEKFNFKVYNVKIGVAGVENLSDESENKE